MIYNAILVDDLDLAIESLTILLRKYPEINIVDTANQMDDAVNKIQKHKPHILFMDIQLQKHTGFDILDKCKGDYKYVVFTTAFDNYIFKSFDYPTIHYLLKPIEEEKLDQVIQKIKDSTSTIDTVLQEDNIKKEKLFFADKDEYISVDIHNIMYIEAKTSYSIIFCENFQIKISKNLTFVENLLSNNLNFIRIHRSYIVNVNFIGKIKRGNSSFLTLINSKTIPISIQEKGTLFKKLGIRE